MTRRSVVITGAGLLSPLGVNVEENLRGIREQRTGITRREEMGDVPESLHWAGRVPEVPQAEDINRKLLSQMKFLNRGSHLGFAAAREAVASSGISLEDLRPERKALYIASGDLTNIDYGFFYPALKDATKGTFRDIDWPRLNESTLGKVNPFYLLESISNNLFSFLSAYFGMMGSSTSIASLSPCGSLALELAVRCIAQGRAEAALAVGCGSWLTDVAVFELEGLGVLSACRDGASSFRPFDAHRDGFMPGEGGAALVLEAEEDARARGATVLGRVKGLGNCIEHTSGRGFVTPEKVSLRCIEEALADAGVSPGGLGFVLPHGSATHRGDHSELASLAEAFGPHRNEVPIAAIKPHTGHMGAASDLAEVIVGARFLKEGQVPATPNFRKAEPEFADLMLSAQQQSAAGSSLLCTSYGVGGQANAVVVEAA